MNKRTMVLSFFGAIFALSLIILIYSASHILTAKSTIEDSIREWDTRDVQGLNDAVREGIGEDLKQRTDSKVDPEKQPLQEDLEAELKKNQITLMGKLIMDRTNDNIPLIMGAELKHLNFGAGYYPQSAQPGEPGNCVVLGHRENVFRNLGELQLKDTIRVETEERIFTYEVIETKVVDKIDDNLLDSSDSSKITLITCYPIRYAGPSSQRYVVTAVLVHDQLS